ncbi:MAG: 16S rRNA (guanine(527)-N(7))-methyltransferase RsmG [Burkholderiales bacterium]|jgi:16S rRNA (guanine527-N7)-methyltransferase|nr:16S rRNA (guanine(527)-N(7))-methyltransferase RsmG [Burkholderiales bacterium]
MTFNRALSIKNDAQDSLADRLALGIGEIGLTFDETQYSRVLSFIYLLKKWNKTYNLTAIDALPDMLNLHIFDTLSVIPYLDDALSRRGLGDTDQAQPLSGDVSACKPVKVLDVGAGAGVPGIILAIARPSWAVTMIDAAQKKAAFCTQAIAELKLPNAKAEHGRIETMMPLAPFEIIISRAFSALTPFVEASRHTLAARGIWAAMKGLNPENEIADLPCDIRVFQNQAVTPPFMPDIQRHLILMEETINDD